MLLQQVFYLIFKDYLFIYLFIIYRERKRGRETSMWVAPHASPPWGPGLQPSHVS